MDLHYIQIALLLQLGKTSELSFSQFALEGLQIEQDLFNYHLQKLVQLGLVVKLEGKYSLSDTGKDFVGHLDFSSGRKERAPKVSIMARFWRTPEKRELLVCRRLKHPAFKMLGQVTGKVKFGESTETAMLRECQEETGLTPLQFKLIGVYRWLDHNSESREIVHDTVFFVYDVEKYNGELIESTAESENFWSTLADLKGNPDLLPTLQGWVDGVELQNIVTTEFVETKAYLKGF